MHHAQMRTIPYLPQVTIGILMLGGLLFAGLLWSMSR
jgi:hypothetical protein